MVLPFTPLFVLAETDKNVKSELTYNKDDYMPLVQESYSTETQLYQALIVQRAYIQAQKMISIMDDIFSYITQDMKTISDKYQKKQEMLASVRKRNLYEFTTERKSTHTDAFEIDALNTKQLILNSVYDLVNKAKSKITNEFDACTTAATIKVFKSEFATLLEKLSDDIVTHARSKYDLINDCAEEQI